MIQVVEFPADVTALDKTPSFHSLYTSISFRQSYSKLMKYLSIVYFTSSVDLRVLIICSLVPRQDKRWPVARVRRFSPSLRLSTTWLMFFHYLVGRPRPRRFYFSTDHSVERICWQFLLSIPESRRSSTMRRLNFRFLQKQAKKSYSSGRDRPAMPKISLCLSPSALEGSMPWLRWEVCQKMIKISLINRPNFVNEKIFKSQNSYDFNTN